MHPHPKIYILLSLTVILLSLLACGEFPGVPRQLAGDQGNSLADLPPSGQDSPDSSSTSSTDLIFVGEVEIQLKDFEIVPTDFTVQAGEVTFILVNAGRFTHDFRVEGEGIDEKSPRISAGRTGEWAIKLGPGVYHLSCPISNHEDRGMIGTLTVTPP